MPYTVYIDESGPWLAIDYVQAVGSDALVAARKEAAALNAEGRIRNFILDFTEVTEFVLSPDAVDRIRDVDRARSEVLPAGRCALVTPRELVEIGTTFLAAVSVLNLDYRTFQSRAQAEAWLRDALPNAPPTLPRKR